MAPPGFSPATRTQFGGPVVRLACRQWLGLRARCTRWSLDARLAAGIDPASEPVLVARAAQLLSQPHRRRLAASIERVVAEADAGRPPSSGSPAVPVVRAQVVEARASLLFIAHLLRFADRVRPRGIAMVDRLLTDGASPLYVRRARVAVELEAQTALDHLVGTQRATPEAWFSTSDADSGDLVGHP